MPTLLEHYAVYRALAVEMMHRLDAEARECLDPTTGVVMAHPSEWRKSGATPPVTDRTYAIVNGRGTHDGGLFLARRGIGDDRIGGGIQFRVLRVPNPWDGSRDILVRVIRTQLRSVLAEYVCPADAPVVAEIKAEAEQAKEERMRLYRIVTERRALLQEAFGPPDADYDALGQMLERVEQTAAQLGSWGAAVLDEIRSDGEAPDYFEAETEAWRTAEADLRSSLSRLVSTAPADRSTADAAHNAARRLLKVVSTLARAEA